MHHSIVVEAFDTLFRVFGYYTPEDRGRTSGPPEHCWPPEPSSFESENVLIGLEDVTLLADSVGVKVGEGRWVTLTSYLAGKARDACDRGEA